MPPSGSSSAIRVWAPQPPAGGLRYDVRAAGALYRDESTILDANLLTCRGSDDLPEFCRRLVALHKSPALVPV